MRVFSSRRSPRWSLPVMTACLSLFPALAMAGPGFSLDMPDGLDPLVYGGVESAECAWPATVSMAGSCTGSLVHPELVIYAAHCGAGYNSITFGNNIGSNKSAPVEFCMTHPQFNGNNLGDGVDFAFCKLAQPVNDVPITPILMGCETSILAPGQNVTIVGFGNADNGPYGIKREVEVPVAQVTDEAFLGGQGKGACNGDSGGPAYVKLSSAIGGDDTWRVFGVTSWGPEGCNQGASFGMMHTAVEWIETNSGVDITPCGGTDGSWGPTFECGSFPLNPGAGGGSWASGCEEGPVGELSNMCGAAATPDEVPPTVEIIAPESGTVFDSQGAGAAEVTIEADAQDEGWGIDYVHLVVNGSEIPNGADTTVPYDWTAAFPAGAYTLVARAVDNGGNMTDSEAVYIGIDQDAPEPPPEPSDEGGEEDGGGTSDDGGGEDDGGGTTTTDGGTGQSGEAGDPAGCACDVRDTSGTPWWSLGLLGFGLAIRRRRAA